MPPSTTWLRLPELSNVSVSATPFVDARGQAQAHSNDCAAANPGAVHGDYNVILNDATASSNTGSIAGQECVAAAYASVYIRCPLTRT